MKQALVNLIKDTQERMTEDVKSTGEIFHKIFEAYNEFQENERDGVDYIFDITKQKDLECCVNGGLSAEEISYIYRSWQDGNGTDTPYFMFGVNNPEPFMIKDVSMLRGIILDSFEDLIPYMIAFPTTAAIGELYRYYITDELLNNCYV